MRLIIILKMQVTLGELTTTVTIGSYMITRNPRVVHNLEGL